LRNLHSFLGKRTSQSTLRKARKILGNRKAHSEAQKVAAETLASMREMTNLYLGALPHAPTSSLVDSRPANRGPSLDRCWGRQDANGRTDCKTAGEGWKT
jgi:hypothetical protein